MGNEIDWGGRVGSKARRNPEDARVDTTWRMGPGQNDLVSVSGPAAGDMTLENLMQVRVEIAPGANRSALAAYAVETLNKCGIDAGEIIRKYEAANGLDPDISDAVRHSHPQDEGTDEKTNPAAKAAQPAKAGLLKRGMVNALTGLALATGAVTGAGGDAGNPNAPRIEHVAADERKRAGNPANQRHGFTLLELLVVMAIVAVLIGMLIPAVQKVRMAAQNTSRSNSMRQLGIAMHNYESANGVMPRSSRYYPNPDPNGQPRQLEVSGIVDLLPFMEGGNAAVRYDMGKTTNQQTDEVKDFVIKQINPGGYPGGIGVALIRRASEGYYPVSDAQIGNAALYTREYNPLGNPQGPPRAVSPGPQWPAVRITDITDGTSNTLGGVQKADNYTMGDQLFIPGHPEGDKDGFLRRRWLHPGTGHGSVGLPPYGLFTQAGSTGGGRFVTPNSDTDRVHFLWADGHASSVKISDVPMDSGYADFIRKLGNINDGQNPSVPGLN